MDDKIKFKEEWITAGIKSLGLKTEKDIELLNTIYEENFIDTELNIFNTDNYSNKRIDSTSAFFKIPETCTINENGVLFCKVGIKRAPTAIVIYNLSNKRQKEKRAKAKFNSLGETFKTLLHTTMELHVKGGLNYYYGLNGYRGSPMYNKDVADTVTTAARNVTAVASIVMESFGLDFRHYAIQAHVAIIELSGADYKDNKLNYTLPDVTDEDVLKVLLGNHYEGYFAKSFLMEKLKHLSKEEKQVLYIRNNFMAWVEVPEVNVVWRRIINKCIKRKINTNKEEDLIGKYCIDNNVCIPIYKETAKDFINKDIVIIDYPFNHKDPLFKDDIKLLKQMAEELLYGTYYFGGDYVNREWCPTTVDIISTMTRDRIVTIDTDSTVSTVFNESRKLIYGTFGDIVDKEDLVMTDGVIPMLIGTVAVACVMKAFGIYAELVGVANEDKHLIEIEMEHVMEHLQLTVSKKQYSFISLVKDYMWNVKKKMDVRGLKYIKSDTNEESAETTDYVISNFIMQKPEKLDHTAIIEFIDNNTKERIKNIESEDYVLNKNTRLKIKEDSRYGDYRSKAVRLWNTIYKDNPNVHIRIPGSFGCIRVKFTKEILDEIKLNYPEVYNRMAEFCTDLFRFKLTSKLVNLGNLWEDDIDQEAIDKKIRRHIPEDLDSREMEKFVDLLHFATKFDETDYFEELWVRLRTELENASTEPYKALLKRIFNKEEKSSDEFIISWIDRIGLPVDMVEVPEWIGVQDYAMVDIESALEVEHLCSSMLYGIGVGITKNGSDNYTVSNIINAF